MQPTASTSSSSTPSASTSQNTQTSKVKSRLNYFRQKRAGITPEAILKQATNDSCFQIAERIDQTLNSHLQQNAQVEEIIGNLTSELASVQLLKPCEKQAEDLKEDTVDFKKEHSELINSIADAEQREKALSLRVQELTENLDRFQNALKNTDGNAYWSERVLQGGQRFCRLFHEKQNR